MVVPFSRSLVAAEGPILSAHRLTMWGYSVLLELAAGAVRTQATLADTLGADRTRLIPVLDELQEEGLIERRRDPADRRVHLLSITTEGRARCRSAQQAIQRQEEERVLSLLTPDDRTALLRALEILSPPRHHPEP